MRSIATVDSSDDRTQRRCRQPCEELHQSFRTAYWGPPNSIPVVNGGFLSHFSLLIFHSSWRSRLIHQSSRCVLGACEAQLWCLSPRNSKSTPLPGGLTCVPTRTCSDQGQVFMSLRRSEEEKWHCLMALVVTRVRVGLTSHCRFARIPHSTHRVGRPCPYRAILSASVSSALSAAPGAQR